jgi:hypothetical protein
MMRLPSSWGEWSSLIGILVVAGGLYLHMHTDLEADQAWENHNSDIAALIQANTDQQRATQLSTDRSEKLRLEREIRRLNQDRKYPDADVAQIDIDIAYYQRIIDCIRLQLILCE